MPNDIHDISDTIVPKSTQLNAEDLLVGPITVTITGIRRVNEDQPLEISITNSKPYFPCKSMRRLMIMAWPDCVIPAVAPATKPTIDPTCWIGRSLKLMRDPNVKWAGALVGGIRIAAMSHIKAKFEVALAESKKSKKLVTVEKLDAPSSTKSEPPKQESKPLIGAGSIASRLGLLKDDWKARRTTREMSVSLADWKAFVVAATEGCVSETNALKAEAFTVEVLDKVAEFLDFEIPA